MKTFYENSFDSLNRRASHFLREAEGSDFGKKELFDQLAGDEIYDSLQLSEIIIGYLKTYFKDRDEDPDIADDYDQLCAYGRDPNWGELDYLGEQYPRLTELLMMGDGVDGENAPAVMYLEKVVDGAIKTFIYNDKHPMPERKRESSRRYDKRLHEDYDDKDYIEKLDSALAALNALKNDELYYSKVFGIVQELKTLRSEAEMLG